MTEMRERVARAICKAESTAGDDTDWRIYEDTARAAIEAMKHPTTAMLNVCANTNKWKRSGEGYLSHKKKNRRRWQAMIDEALRNG